LQAKKVLTKLITHVPPFKQGFGLQSVDDKFDSITFDALTHNPCLQTNYFKKSLILKVSSSSG
jgi:hypothetical protein